MVSLQPPVCDFGWKAPDFKLPGVDGRMWTLADVRGPNGTLVMFICNHCPYVKAIMQRLVDDVRELKALGVNAVAIMSNDVNDYPEDSFENMKVISNTFDFSFPYVLDDAQLIAKAYDAVCTPDFFGFNASLELQYRGRFDASRKETANDSSRDLFYAMRAIAQTGVGPVEQIASMGCSIKWKSET
ncbi:alkyl hydroperoxide reductase [Methylovorus sp. MM2]|uniref:thioredoxin family protein n=1 Tax=Methylovorus sp. MM2 TaxID=1848038 RepID=UPI0007E1EBBA|nr:thioredoxin family protein [Methylovorus sp. MM2]OAM52349.1 alkyl hydroperoxide reductase [Methylovorus sp. MM2]